MASSSGISIKSQGGFPAAAYLGAWYYLPAQTQNNGNWNLFHYQGGAPGQMLHYLWDVSLVSSGPGAFITFIGDRRRRSGRERSSTPSMTWRCPGSPSALPAICTSPTQLRPAADAWAVAESGTLIVAGNKQ